MPVYFFHVLDTKNVLDVEGTVLDDIGSARREAIRAAGSIISECDPDILDTAPWRMRVTDDAGSVVCILTFSALSR